MLAITRRTCLEGMLAATASVSLAPAALAQNLEDQSIARADTLIATGQPSGGAPTFTQYNDFNPLHPGLDLRSSIAFVLEPLFFYSVLDDKMIPWLAESYEYGDDYTQIRASAPGRHLERRHTVRSG
jgi:ABC-type transport system substrate-binding protein